MLERIKEWGKENEGLLRLLEVAAVLVFGGVITAVVSYQQIRLAEVEAAVAQASLEPKFEFVEDDSSDGTRAILVGCARPDVKILSASAVLVLDQRLPDGRFVRIAMPDVYESALVADDNAVRLSCSKDARLAANQKFLTNWQTSPEGMLRRDRVVRLLVNVQFENALKEWHLRSFLVNDFDLSAEAAGEKLEFDAFVNTRGRDGDFDKVTAEVEEIVAEGPQPFRTSDIWVLGSASPDDLPPPPPPPSQAWSPPSPNRSWPSPFPYREAKASR